MTALAEVAPFGIGDWLDIAPWRSPLLLLVLNHPEGHIVQAFRLNDKRALLTQPGTIVAVWPGQWRTTCRVLTDDDRESVAAVLR